VNKVAGEDEEFTWQTSKDVPAALAKAIEDEFDYALGLRNGVVIRFGHAKISEDGAWVHLDTPTYTSGSWVMSGVEMPFERGLDVRLADVVWVADAPYGS